MNGTLKNLKCGPLRAEIGLNITHLGKEMVHAVKLPSELLIGDSLSILN